uniref:Protein crumbs-like n=1 Tax=Crassostrea virginica TaxID=6565 RepID=A0A8B8DHA0_CRAVI|nr:protein crumbs-like [Crassostrea virginica]
MAGPDSSQFPPFQIMTSILCLGFALVAALTSTVDAQEEARGFPRRCSSFPIDTCPVGYTCNRDRICERVIIDPFTCRFDSECPRDYECRQRRCVPRQNCIANPWICQPFEYCNRRTGRCEVGVPDDCRTNPSICGPFQTCNIRTGRCESEEPDCRTFPCGPGQTCQYRFGRYQCVSTSPPCRPWVPSDCPRGYYCSSQRVCLPDFPFGGRASGSPAAASTSGDGM